MQSERSMQTRLPITTPDTSFTDCLSIMNEGRMGVALVMENQQLKGIITDGDVRRALTANGADTLNKTAKELMTSSPKTIHENEFLAKAEDLMKEKKIHSLVVVNDENKCCGLSGVLKLMINEKLKKIKIGHHGCRWRIN